MAYWADWPVNEADLHARHKWLVAREEFRQRMRADPDYFDAQIAGWWVWGISQWIGSGWCSAPEWEGRAHPGNGLRGIHSRKVRDHTKDVDYDAAGAIVGYEFMNASRGLNLDGLPHREEIAAFIPGVAGLRVLSKAS